MPKKIALTIGVYNLKLISQASPMCGDQVFAKGLEANGYKVHRIDYRAVDANIEVKKLPDTFYPDIIWLGKCEKVLPETIRFLKVKYPLAIICKWGADVRNEPSLYDTDLLQAGVDWFFATYAGDHLKKHLFPGMKGVGSIFTFTDSSFYCAKEVDDIYTSDVLWTGRRGFGDNPVRNEIIDKLSAIVEKQAGLMKDRREFDIAIFGHDGKVWLGEKDYVNYINGTKIGIGSNSFNRRKYSSDRLGNYMSCGTFFLTQHIEGIEELFERGVHLDWFYTVDEMMEKIKFYLERPELRYNIAQRGRELILKHFDYKPLILNLLRIIETNAKQNTWEEVYTNPIIKKLDTEDTN